VHGYYFFLCLIIAAALGKPLAKHYSKPTASTAKKAVSKTIRRLSGGRKSLQKSAPTAPHRLILLKKKQTQATGLLLYFLPSSFLQFR
jgi:hypothetical protein